MQSHRIAAGFAIASGAVFIAAPLHAQDVLPADPFGMAMELCSSAIAEGPLTAASEALTAAGWSIDYGSNVGRAAQTLRASNASLGGGGYFLAETAQVGNVFRMRCAIDIPEFTSPVDFDAVAAAHGLEGSVTALPDGSTHGSWSMALDDGVALFSAFHAGDLFGFEMTWAEWGQPRG